MQEQIDAATTQIGDGKLISIEDITSRIERPPREKRSDIIHQTLLNASKLLEGRFTFTEVCQMDIPTFQSMVDNELENIKLSIERFKETGIMNAYTKDEKRRTDDKDLKEIDKMFEGVANRKR